MRIYQMEREEVAARLGCDLESGKENVPRKMENRTSGSVIAFLRSLFEVLRAKFNYVNILVVLCYTIALIFSWLNHSWNVLGFTIASFVLTVLLYLCEGSWLCYYKRKYYERSVRSRQTVHAIRAGKQMELDPDELVVGDLIVLEMGAVLYCDARIVECEGLFADEKTVFGSTIPAAKTPATLQDKNLTPENQKNMVWKGGYITAGSGRAIVTAVENDCYIEKTGGRKQRKQRSFFYNKQNNIGRIASYVFAILSAISLLAAILFTNRYVEAFLVMGVASSLILLNPVTCLMEWTYYRTAAKFYRQGILIRNIEAFDGLNKEKELYFEANNLIKDQLRYSHTVDLHGSEKSTLSYFSLCMGSGYFTDELKKALDTHGLTYEQLDRSFPVFRREIDEKGNVFSLFSNNGNSVVVAAGYWKKMLPLIQTMDESLEEQIKEFEIHGKMVYIMASDSMNFIPNKLELSYFEARMELSALVIFDVPVNKKLLSMIGQLRHASMKAYLISDYSDEFGKVLADSYDMDEVISEAPEKQCYSLPCSGGSSSVVYESLSSPIEREQAMVVLKDDAAPQELIYRVKCMFCGIRRCLNFLAITGALMIFTVLTLFLMDVAVEKLVFSVLLLKPVLICPCYYLIESVRNCNQYRRSLILGLFCGSAGLVTALIGCDSAIFALALSTVLLSAYFMLSGAKYRPIRKQDVIYLIISLLLVVIPVVLIESYWLPALLLAFFPPLAAFVLDLFY